MTFLIQQTLLYAVPLMIVALAGVFAERSGIINLALEGIMIFGAFIGVLFVNSMQNMALFINAARSGNWVLLQLLEIGAMLVAASLGAVFSLLGAMQITIPSIVRAIKNRPRADWEDEEEHDQRKRDHNYSRHHRGRHRWSFV